MKKVKKYPNAVEVKWLNKKIQLIDNTKDELIINFKFACEDAIKPACMHNTLKGKVRQTSLKLSKDAMEELVYAYCVFKNK